MSIITVFSGRYCNEDDIIDEIKKNTGFEHIEDHAVTAEASELSGLSIQNLEQAFSENISVFNNFTHEKECSTAYHKLALAGMIKNRNIIISGYSSLLIPKAMPDVLRTGLAASLENRLKTAQDKDNLSIQAARQIIEADDQKKSNWTQFLFSQKNPWDISLYDLMISTDKAVPAEIPLIIKERLSEKSINHPLNPDDAMDDFILAANVEASLANAGHHMEVKAENGSVVLTVYEQVLQLNQLEDELQSVIRNIQGVNCLEIKQGHKENPCGTYRKHDRKYPSKVLLVDDEKEFVLTLSERLQMRDIGSAVAFNGQTALNIVNTDDPEVIIMDLKMPGMDGMEVLKRVKQIRPEIEIIILTGHGSETDRKKCMDLGAFAYLQKPVDINLLNDSLNQAHGKIRAKI